MTYEELLAKADNENIIVKEKPLSDYDGRIMGKRIAIRKDIETSVEKSCVLAEELGHYYTTYGDIREQSNIISRKQERRARLYSYDLQIGLSGLIRAYEAGCYNLEEMADFLEVTEKFLFEALQCYREKYGMCKSIDDYIIYFEPYFRIMKAD